MYDPKETNQLGLTFGQYCAKVEEIFFQETGEGFPGVSLGLLAHWEESIEPVAVVLSAVLGNGLEPGYEVVEMPCMKFQTTKSNELADWTLTVDNDPEDPKSFFWEIRNHVGVHIDSERGFVSRKTAKSEGMKVLDGILVWSLEDA